MERLSMTNGIYCYIDNKDDSIVYVGRDSYIHQKARHKYHLNKKNHDSQPINRILQNNPDRYNYNVLAQGNFTNDELNNMETLFIEMYDTYNNEHKFNYTKGGDGVVGFTMSEEHKNILKKCNAGNNYATGSKHTDEWKRKASYYRRGKFNPNYNKKFDLNHRLKLSKNNKSGAYRVFKFKDKRCKKGYRWLYKYYDGKKYRHIYSNALEKLEMKVLEKNLEWIIIDETKYNNSLKEDKNGTI